MAGIAANSELVVAIRTQVEGISQSMAGLRGLISNLSKMSHLELIANVVLDAATYENSLLDFQRRMGLSTKSEARKLAYSIGNELEVTGAKAFILIKSISNQYASIMGKEGTEAVYKAQAIAAQAAANATEFDVENMNKEIMNATMKLKKGAQNVTVANFGEVIDKSESDSYLNMIKRQHEVVKNKEDAASKRQAVNLSKLIEGLEEARDTSKEHYRVLATIYDKTKSQTVEQKSASDSVVNITKQAGRIQEVLGSIVFSSVLVKGTLNTIETVVTFVANKLQAWSDLMEKVGKWSDVVHLGIAAVGITALLWIPKMWAAVSKGKGIIGMIANSMTKLPKPISDVVWSVFKGVTKVGTGISNFVVKISKGVGESISNIAGGMSQGIIKLGHSVGIACKTAAKGSSGLLQLLGVMLVGSVAALALGKAIQCICKGVAKLYEAVVPFAQIVGNVIIRVIDSIVELARLITGAVSKLIDGIVELARIGSTGMAGLAAGIIAVGAALVGLASSAVVSSGALLFLKMLNSEAKKLQVNLSNTAKAITAVEGTNGVIKGINMNTNKNSDKNNYNIDKLIPYLESIEMAIKGRREMLRSYV